MYGDCKPSAQSNGPMLKKCKWMIAVANHFNNIEPRTRQLANSIWQPYCHPEPRNPEADRRGQSSCDKVRTPADL